METINIIDPPKNEPFAPKPDAENIPVKINSKLKIGLGILLFLILLNVVVLILKPKANQVVLEPSPLATVIPTATDSASQKNQSEFSKLPDYQKFEQNLKDTISVNDNLDLSNSKLNFPLLEMNVNFTQ